MKTEKQGQKPENHKTAKESKYSPEAQETIKHLQENLNGADLLGQCCIDHPELPAKGVCSITDEPYCELCITKENDIRFARKFLNMFLDSEWEMNYFVHDEQIGADTLNELFKVKHDILKELNIPLITQKQFKINIENDKIEPYTVVLGRKSDREQIESKLGFLKQH